MSGGSLSSSLSLDDAGKPTQAPALPLRWSRLPGAPVHAVCNSDTRTSNSDTRTCNSVSRKFRTVERATHASLTLCGNARNLHLIPTWFSSVSDLDLDLSPWGHALLSPSGSSTDPALLAHRLRLAFPVVTSLTVYSRSSTVEIVSSLWPRLRRVTLSYGCRRGGVEEVEARRRRWPGEEEGMPPGPLLVVGWINRGGNGRGRERKKN
ncbi:hypothetical protein ACLB2K_000761 [Fragaria x ananassa]